ncbi:hypothetical protein SAMN04489749_1167 [Bifidobacterium longum]|nr:hypothetical protein SAMN04489749_1167 [Bifidobacterium longum]
MPLNTSTNGLSPTPALRHGISAHITVIEPMKKSTRRHSVVWMAFGTAVCGSLVSPAVTPMSSVPENAKLTVRIVANTGMKPLGKTPSLMRLPNIGACW